MRNQEPHSGKSDWSIRTSYALMVERELRKHLHRMEEMVIYAAILILINFMHFSMQICILVPVASLQVCLWTSSSS